MYNKNKRNNTRTYDKSRPTTKPATENSTHISMLESYQRFTVDQASHSEGLPRESLLGQSRVQILQEANAGFGGAVCSTIASGAHLVVWKKWN